MSVSDNENESYKHLIAVSDGLFELLEYAMEVRLQSTFNVIKH